MEETRETGGGREGGREGMSGRVKWERPRAGKK